MSCDVLATASWTCVTSLVERVMRLYMSNLLISSGEYDCTFLNCSLRRMLANWAATYAAIPPATNEHSTLPTEHRIMATPSSMMASAGLPSLNRTVILDM